MQTTKKAKVYNLVILDKSGSMLSIRKEAVDGYNETLGSIRATQLKFIDTQEHFVSLAAFCSCGIEMIYDMTPIKDAENLSMKKYVPCCNTPLLDAIGQTVTTLKKKIADVEDSAVLVTIITDGYENASKEWSGKAVSKLIEECKEEGWMFSFIGAGEEVIKTAKDLSITNTMLWQNTSEGTKNMFHVENVARDMYCCRLAEPGMQGLSRDEKIKAKKKLSEEYYEKK